MELSSDEEILLSSSKSHHGSLTRDFSGSSKSGHSDALDCRLQLLFSSKSDSDVTDSLNKLRLSGSDDSLSIPVGSADECVASTPQQRQRKAADARRARQSSGSEDEEAFEKFIQRMKGGTDKPQRPLSDDDEVVEGHSHEVCSDDDDDDASLDGFIVSDDASLSFATDSGDDSDDGSAFYLKTTNLLNQNRQNDSHDGRQKKTTPAYRDSASVGSSNASVGSGGGSVGSDGASVGSDGDDYDYDDSFINDKSVRSWHSASQRSFSQQVSFTSDPGSEVKASSSQPPQGHGQSGSTSGSTSGSGGVLLLSDDDDLTSPAQQTPSQGLVSSSHSGPSSVLSLSDDDDGLFDRAPQRPRGQSDLQSGDGKENPRFPSEEKNTRKLVGTTPSKSLLSLRDLSNSVLNASLPSLGSEESDDNVLEISEGFKMPATPPRHRSYRDTTSERKPSYLGSVHGNLRRTEPRPARRHDTVCSFIASLSTVIPDGKTHDPEADRFLKQYKKHRASLIDKLFKLFNETVFDNQLTAVPVQINKRLLKTAGLCTYCTARTTRLRSARIDLSEKVCDSPERVRDTLIHEMCHAAVWIVDGVKEGHGSRWKYWARRSQLIHRELPAIRRCHSYAISCKYVYKCSTCGQEVGRHSKSLNTETRRCGICRGTFVLHTRGGGSGGKGGGDSGLVKTPARTPNKFAMFVKENFASVKKAGQLSTHKEVMQELASQFSKLKS